MKNINLLNTGVLLLLLIFSGLSVRAGNLPDVEKKKTFTKTYSIGRNDKINIRNKFGEVKVNGWSRNEVKVDVIIIARSSTDERAQEILDRISIEDGKNASGVHFNTVMKNDNKNSGDNRQYKEEKMEINYQVSMPLFNPLSMSNDFGATILPDMTGLVEISSKFGKLTAGKLANVKKVSVEFGSASIESINSGDLVIRFSRSIVNRLDGAVNASFEHCSGVKLGIENSTKNLTVKNNFTTLYLDLSKNFSADFDIKTHFGKFKNETAYNIKEEVKEERRGPNFDRSYSGKSGSGAAGMKIKSDFGEIVLGHNLTMDLKEEKGKKEHNEDMTTAANWQRSAKLFP